jgi:hypothetical protein
MNVGTKSVLFGVHCFLWHPITVWLAWVELYGLPSWKETVCIFIHDLGYWGCPNMDGEEGENHPEWAADFASVYLDKYKMFCRTNTLTYWKLCIYHSRHYARKHNATPSRLCWADKLSIKYDPAWFYLLRASLSGEIKEYRKLASDVGSIPATASDKEWFAWASGRFIKMGYQGNSEGVPFQREI